MRRSQEKGTRQKMLHLYRAHFSTDLELQIPSAKTSSGFTLLEVLIASIVVIVGLMSLLSLILFGLKMRYDSRLSSTALKLSQQMIEELKSRSPDDPLLAHSGNVLTPDGAIDFEASLDALASSTKSLQLNETRNTHLVFETRWNITSLGNKRILTVATRKSDWSTSQFSPVNLKVALTSP
jgi:Tfp pilus assembly protein PilV